MSSLLLEDTVIPPIRYGSDPIRLESCPKWVRAFSGGELVVDSRRVTMMLEQGHLPVYYFPKQDVRMELLTPAPSHRPAGLKGPATLWTLDGARGLVGDAFFSYEQTPAGCPDLSGLIGMYWARMDAIFEEEEEVFGHARDPYHRVEILPTSRHVRIAVGDVPLAESTRCQMLLETHLPVRYYFPKLDVKFNQLERTETTSLCPYKGKATQYWAVEGTGRDVAWCYPATTLPCNPIANRVAFFQERVDLYVDGSPLPFEGVPYF